MWTVCGKTPISVAPVYIQRNVNSSGIALDLQQLSFTQLGSSVSEETYPSSGK